MSAFSFLETFLPLANAATVTQKASEAGKSSEDAVSQLLTVLWDKIDNWIAAIVVTIIAFFVAKMIQSAVIDRISQHFDEEQQDVLILAGRATYIAVLAVGITIGLKVAGIDITAIIAAIGFGIGFAMQDLIMNFISGVMILISRQFNLGDFILIDGVIGQVKEIQSRSTILQALDGTKVIVPNKDLFSSMVTSYTTNPFRRIDVPVGVDYATNLPKAIEISMKTINENNYILKEPKPGVLIDAFADSSINLILRFWVESKSNFLGIRSQVIMELKKNFDTAGITIPFPIRTIHMSKEEQQLSKAMEEAGIAPKMPIGPELLTQVITSNGQQVSLPISHVEAIMNSSSVPPEKESPQDEPKNENSNIPVISDEGASFLRKLQEDGK